MQDTQNVRPHCEAELFLVTASQRFWCQPALKTYLLVVRRKGGNGGIDP